MTTNNFTIKGSNGQIYPLNALFTTGATNNASEFNFLKNKDSNGVMTNYITGVSNKQTYLSSAATPDREGINGADDDGTKLGYLKNELNNWNNGFGLDSCTFTDYQGPVGSGGITANYLGAYFINYTNIDNIHNTVLATWCDYIIIVMVGGGGGGGSQWTNDDSYILGGGGGGGGYVISKSFNLIENNITKLTVSVGWGGESPTSEGENGGNGYSSNVLLKDSNNIIQVEVKALGGKGGSIGDAGVDCKGGVGGSYEVTGNMASSWPPIQHYMNGFNGEDGYRGDDGGGSNWGSRGGMWGAESLVGCFYDSNQLNTYNANAYGRGGRGSGVGDDNGDGASEKPNGTRGGRGWVRIYFMRN